MPSAFVAFGIEKGMFRKQKLEIDLQPTQGGAATIPALVSGDIQIGGSNVVSLLLASSKDLPIRAIAGGTVAKAEGEKDFGALLAAKGKDIEQPEDLAGKTIAVNTLNNIAEVVVKAALEKQGVDPESLKLSEVPFPEMAPALDKGSVDAAFNIEPFVTQSVQAGRRGARLLLRRDRVGDAGRRLRGDEAVRRAERRRRRALQGGDRRDRRLRRRPPGRVPDLPVGEREDPAEAGEDDRAAEVDRRGRRRSMDNTAKLMQKLRAGRRADRRRQAARGRLMMKIDAFCHVMPRGVRRAARGRRRRPRGGEPPQPHRRHPGDGRPRPALPRRWTSSATTTGR